MREVEEAVAELVSEMRGLLDSPAFAFSSSFAALSETRPFARLVELGDSALPALASRLEAGDLFLVGAVMAILGINSDELGLGTFPTEQELAAALIKFARLPVVTLHLTAGSGSATAAADRSTLAQGSKSNTAIKNLQKPKQLQALADRLAADR